MNSNCISVKSNNASFLTKGLMWLALMVFAMICAFMPVFAGIEGGGATALKIVGWTVFAVAAAVFVMLIIKELRPSDAIVLDSRGFRENRHIDGVEVEWTNVSSVGIYGTKKSPLFGITFENNDIVIDKLRKRSADEMRDNIEENLPSVLIPQNEVKMPLRELRDLFNRFIREARTLEDNNAVHKQKVNPFTTEDVLRAFGQLPKKEEEKKDEPDDRSATKVLPDKPEEESDDDFYASLRMKVGEKAAGTAAKAVGAETRAETPAEAGNDDIPDEMKEILSKVKSHKISEIEKLLADKDIPYSAVREIEEKAAAAKIAAEQAQEAEEEEDETPSGATKVFEPIKPDAPVKAEEALPDDSADDGEEVSPYYGAEEDVDDEEEEEEGDINTRTVIFDTADGSEDEIFDGDRFSRSSGKTVKANEQPPKELKLPPVNAPGDAQDDDVPGIIFINDD